MQRVLVDGWTPEEAGAPFGVDERRVARWVAAYRRHGMAALRGEVAVESGPRRWIERCLGWIGACLAAAHDGRRPGGAAALGAPETPTRHWRWS